MPPQLLIDLERVDLDRIAYDVPGIERYNPHRGAMRQLDSICRAAEDEEYGLHAVGFKDCRDEEFWVPGHIPGRPLLPGVLMIEAAAQLASFMIKLYRDEPGFLGFLGCDEVKFRGQVKPGQRLYILGHETEYRHRRRFVCRTQAVCEGELVFEGTIKGMSF